MKVRVRLTAIESATGKVTVLADGVALYDGKRLLYKEKGTGVKHEVTRTDKGLRIKRSADVTSVTDLPLKGRGSAKVISEYGVMEVEAVTESMTVDESCWVVEYRIESDGGSALHQRLEWHINHFV